MKVLPITQIMMLPWKLNYTNIESLIISVDYSLVKTKFKSTSNIIQPWWVCINLMRHKKLDLSLTILWIFKGSRLRFLRITTLCISKLSPKTHWNWSPSFPTWYSNRIQSYLGINSVLQSRSSAGIRVRITWHTFKTMIRLWSTFVTAVREKRKLQSSKSTRYPFREK